MSSDSADTRAVDPDEGFKILTGLVQTTLQSEFDGAQSRVVHQFGLRLQACLELSSEIASVLGQTQAEVLSHILRILSTTSQDPEAFLRNFVQRFKDLQARLGQLESGTELSLLKQKLSDQEAFQQQMRSQFQAQIDTS